MLSFFEVPEKMGYLQEGSSLRINLSQKDGIVTLLGTSALLTCDILSQAGTLITWNPNQALGQNPMGTFWGSEGHPTVVC